MRARALARCCFTGISIKRRNPLYGKYVHEAHVSQKNGYCQEKGGESTVMRRSFLLSLTYLVRMYNLCISFLFPPGINWGASS